MSRHVVCFSLAFAGVVFFSLLLGFSEAEADSPITLISQNHTFSYAQQIRFAAEFSSTNPITNVTLLFAAQDDWRVFNATIPVSGDQNRVVADYLLNLQEYPLRPFAQVEYWWYVEAADGTILETEPLAFSYSDNRYDWHAAAEGGIRVFWAADDPALGHTALRIARDGLERIQAVLPGPLDREITIYIYPSLSELRSALQLAGREWVGGIADPASGIILVSAISGPTANIELQQILPHEVAHFAIEQSAGGDDNQVPFWLHEGLSSRNELQPDPTFAIALEQAVQEKSLFPLETLCAPPIADQSSALLFYAQSTSVVRYIQNLYGNETVQQLLRAYGDGADCNGGVERVLGISLDQLDNAWREAYHQEAQEELAQPINVSNLTPWIALIAGAALLSGAFFVFRPREEHDGMNYEHLA